MCLKTLQKIENKKMTHMKNLYVIAKREFISYISSPMMYLIYGIFFFLLGMMFIFQLDSFNEYCRSVSAEIVPLKLSLLDVNFNVLGNLSKNIAFVIIFFLPIITMKLIAEERKTRTIELLMTSPISSYEIVLGKFFAALLLWVILCLCLVVYPWILTNLPNVYIDWGVFFTSLLGLVLYGMLGIAVGLLASSLTDSPLISAFVGFVFMAILYFIIFIALKTDTPFGNFFYGISTLGHLVSFFSGVVDTSNIVYFLSSTIFVLFLAERVLESQRWR